MTLDAALSAYAHLTRTYVSAPDEHRDWYFAHGVALSEYVDLLAGCEGSR